MECRRDNLREEVARKDSKAGSYGDVQNTRKCEGDGGHGAVGDDK